MAPVDGSGSCPAWMALVANFISSYVIIWLKDSIYNYEFCIMPYNYLSSVEKFVV